MLYYDVPVSLCTFIINAQSALFFAAMKIIIECDYNPLNFEYRSISVSILATQDSLSCLDRAIKTIL